MLRHRETICLLSLVLLLIFSIQLLGDQVHFVISRSVTSKHTPFTVVIDAGHGGFDSGKIGVDGTYEKDVNLAIAKKLEGLLKNADIRVFMTRTEDTDLCEDTSSSKKRQDMANRAKLINQADADCVISIHQNSYPSSEIKGAQVFYFTGSAKGEQLAALIQNALVTKVDPSNHRKEKSNDSYYLLKNSTAPMVIVECGFLSNWEESKKLVDDTYQQKLAWAIHLGVLQYLNLNSHISK